MRNMLKYHCRRSGLGVVDGNPEFGHEDSYILMNRCGFVFTRKITP